LPNDERSKLLEFRNEIIECLIDYSTVIEGDSPKSRRKSAEEYLKDSFFISGGSYDKPDYETMLRVLKVLATKELKTGKDRKIISANFLRIAGRIRSLQQGNR
jgi:hypothetical protein